MNKPIWELVIEDMEKRHQKGLETYGVPLTAHNGRNALQDAYEEALDLAAYLKQAIIEGQTIVRPNDSIPPADTTR